MKRWSRPEIEEAFTQVLKQVEARVINQLESAPSDDPAASERSRDVDRIPPRREAPVPRQTGTRGSAGWTRSEIEDAFTRFQQATLRAGTFGNWREWVNMFTKDATYVDSNFQGSIKGRETICKEFTSYMGSLLKGEKISFPIEWYIIDEERGWLVCHMWWRMADPGDGSIHQEYSFTLLKYAGNGLWSYEQDVYSKARFTRMLREYWKHKENLDARRISTPRTPRAIPSKSGRSDRGSAFY